MKQLLKKLTYGKRRTGTVPSVLAFADAAAVINHNLDEILQEVH